MAVTGAAEGPCAGPPASTAQGAAVPAATRRSFAQAVQEARRATSAGRTPPEKRRDAAVALVTARASPRRAAGAAPGHLEVARAAAGEGGAAALRDPTPLEAPAPIASAAAVARVALAAQRLGPAASLELRFSGELGIALTQTPQGVAVVVDPGAIPRVRALAELPRLVRALRDRGVSVASARVAGLPPRVDARESLR